MQIYEDRFMKGEIMKASTFAKKITWVFAFIYFASFITRINFAAVMVEIINKTGHTTDAISPVLVGIAISYGLGQVINGWIGDKIKPQNLILCGLVIATLMNFVLPVFSYSVPIMTTLWTINGFAQAMIWPPIVKILVASPLSEEEYGYSVVRITSASTVAAILMYSVAPLLIKILSWEWIFVICATIGLSASIFWLLSKEKITASACFDTEEKTENSVPAPFKFPKEAVLPMVFIFFAIICQGMVRDGITSFSPNYISEVFNMSPEDGIAWSLPLAIFSTVAIFIAGEVYKRFFKNEITCGMVLYLFALAFSLVLCALFDFNVVVVVICMTLLTGAIQGIGLMLITHVPKRFKKYGNISTISGVINACTYLGSAIASFTVPAIVSAFNWQVAAGSWCAIIVVGMACCFIASRKWGKFINKD